MKMRMWTMHIDDLTSNANHVREILAASLAQEGIIDQNTANKITNEYSVLVVEKGVLGRAVDKLFNKDDVPRYQLVKLITTIQEQKNDNQPEGSA